MSWVPPPKACHYAYVFSSSMSIHVTGTACGTSVSEKWFTHFASPEEAMGTSPGLYGWWSDDAQHVDCPKCIANMAQIIDARRLEAQNAVISYRVAVTKLDEQSRIALAKLDAQKKQEGP